MRDHARKWIPFVAQADAGVVFEIISTHGFAEKLTPRLARSVIEALTSNAALFTARQVRRVSIVYCFLLAEECLKVW